MKLKNESIRAGMAVLFRLCWALLVFPQLPTAVLAAASREPGKHQQSQQSLNNPAVQAQGDSFDFTFSTYIYSGFQPWFSSPIFVDKKQSRIPEVPMGAALLPTEDSPNFPSIQFSHDL